MDWQDDGIVIARRKHGETALIATLLTREHGLHAGLIHGGTSTRNRATFQIGNLVRAEWRARLADHLGTIRAETLAPHAAGLLDRRQPLAALGAAAALVEAVLPEREPNRDVFEVFSVLLADLDGPDWAAGYGRFELALLAALGYGLDLEACAASGAREDLAFVSPRTGRAVSRTAGRPWAERLLPLPAFLTGQAEAPGPGEVATAMRLTGHFFERQALAPAGRRMPGARVMFYDAMVRDSARSSGRAPDGTP